MPPPLGSQRFHTAGYQGYAVEFSPFASPRLACASASNYGIVGSGRLWVLGVADSGLGLERAYDTKDGLFDVAWSELSEAQLVTGSGDGSVRLWDLHVPDGPVQGWQEHTREIFTISWNLVAKDTFVTGSWDHSIKLWSPTAPESLRTYAEAHTSCIYTTAPSPHHPTTLLSVSGDSTIKIWDTQAPGAKPALMVYPSTAGAHVGEILCGDWHKYNAAVFVTSGVDGSAKVWDSRFLGRGSMLEVPGAHEYAIRRVKWSPHDAWVFGTASYDMSMRLWDISGTAAAVGAGGAGLVAPSQTGPTRALGTYAGHSEFVFGLDWNLHARGQMATCAWDEQVHVGAFPM